MKKYAIIDYEFSGKTNWENAETIRVNDSSWYKPRCKIKRINLLQYLIFIYANQISEYITRGSKIEVSQNTEETLPTILTPDKLKWWTMEHRRCNNCLFFMTQDEGYSDYTIEITVVHCLKNNNSYFPIGESYSWEREDSPDYIQLQIAETCEYYKEGEGLVLSVDDPESDVAECGNAELIKAYNAYMSNPDRRILDQ